MEKQLPRRRQRRASEMYPIVESYLASDLGREAFCQEAGISVSTLSYWQTKYRKEQRSSSRETQSGFMTLSVEASHGTEEALLELVWVNGHRLRFMHYPEVSLFTSLVIRINAEPRIHPSLLPLSRAYRYEKGLQRLKWNSGKRVRR